MVHASRPRIAVAVAIAAAFLVGCSPAPTATSSETPAASASTSPAVPSVTPAQDLVLAAALGDWRPSPIQPDAALHASIESACHHDVGIGARTLAVTDIRGERVGAAVYADETSALVCHVQFDATGAASVTMIAPLEVTAPPLANESITLGAMAVLEDAGRQRTLLAGQTGAAAKAVIAGFDDESEVVASLGRGWYLAWWPGTALPGGVGAVDSRRLVIASLDP